jgi:hypothetical protein
MKRDILIIGLIALLAGVMSISSYSTGQFWWDDFASYLLQARAILEGRMAEFVAENGRAIAQSTYPVGPAAYPWGFPLLLAPLYALFGLSSLTAYKLVNTLAFGGFLVVFYAYARRRFNQSLSAALVAALAFNPTLLKATDLILADFTFLFISTAALLLLDRPQRTLQSQILSGGLIFLAFFVRTNGILLLGPLLLLDLLRWRTHPRPDLRFVSLPYLTFLSLLGVSLLFFPGGQGSYFNHYGLFFSPARLLDNFLFYLALPGWLFEQLPLNTLLFALTGLAALWGILKKARAELPALTFSLLSLALFISWPERQGLRFIYPILPFYLVFAAHGLSDLASRIRLKQHSANKNWLLPTGLFGSLAILSLLITFQQTGWRLFGREEINGPFDPVSAEMFAYVRENTAPESTLIFFKPRLMKLLTGRYSILIEDCARLGEADYVIIHEKQERNGQIHPDEIKTCNPKVGLQVVFKNQRFTVYQVNP